MNRTDDSATTTGLVSPLLNSVLRVVCMLCAIGSLATVHASAAGPVAAANQKVQITRDIVYAKTGNVELRCDVYSPVHAAQTVDTNAEDANADDASATANTSAPPSFRPAVLVIHGGAWSSGSKTFVANYANQLAQAGAVAVAIDYRHAPVHKFPAQVDDVRDALVWVNENAEEWKIDTQRVGLFGYSAGGHLACMLATLVDEPQDVVATTTQWNVDDQRWKKLPSVKAVVAGGPPCDLTTIPPRNTGLEFFLGGTRAQKPDVYIAASPISFASAGDTPICFIHGEKDFIVPIQSSRVLYDAQVACGVKSEFVTIEKQGHMFTFVHPKTGDALRDFMTRMLEMPQTAATPETADKPQ